MNIRKIIMMKNNYYSRILKKIAKEHLFKNILMNIRNMNKMKRANTVKFSMIDKEVLYIVYY
jgi:DNA-binding Xre family transcriptional regulator